MSNLNLYVAFFQKPESGVMETSKTVRSLGLGNSMLATLPPSSSAISVFGGEKENVVREMHAVQLCNRFNDQVVANEHRTMTE